MESKEEDKGSDGEIDSIAVGIEGGIWGGFLGGDSLPSAKEVFEESKYLVKRFRGLMEVSLAEFGEHVVVEQAEAGGKLGAFLTIKALIKFDKNTLSTGNRAAASEDFAALEKDKALLDGLDGAFIKNAGELKR